MKWRLVVGMIDELTGLVARTVVVVKQRLDGIRSRGQIAVALPGLEPGRDGL
jgi:hypothetical protein